MSELYSYNTIVEFLRIFGMVSSTIIDREDFARCAYESLEDGVTLGNLKYREMFFNPTLHTRRGVPMATVIDGLVDGIRAAEHDFGVGCRLIADVYRQDPPDLARQMVEEVLANRVDRAHRPRHGRRRGARPAGEVRRGVRPCRSRRAAACTSHACEDAPAGEHHHLPGCARL